MSSVYMFNATPYTISVTVNGGAPAYGMNGAVQQYNYAPFSAQALRSGGQGPSGNEYFIGDNTVIIVFPDLPTTFMVDIPNSGTITPDTNLILYITKQVLVLINANSGMVLTQETDGANGIIYPV